MLVSCFNYTYPDDGRKECRADFPAELREAAGLKPSEKYFVQILDKDENGCFVKFHHYTTVASNKKRHMHWDGENLFPVIGMTTQGRVELVEASFPFALGDYDAEVSGELVQLTLRREPPRVFSIKSDCQAQGLTVWLPQELLEFIGAKPGERIYCTKEFNPGKVRFIASPAARGVGRSTGVKFPETKFVLPWLTLGCLMAAADVVASVTRGGAWSIDFTIKEKADA